jgi:asparagine synthase (glutamine-hydrolysing)
MLLPGNNLTKPDRMGMAASLEARTPYLDYRMVEFAMTIPGNLKLRNGETKYILKRALRRILGDDVLGRRKQMFTVPIGEWMRKDLANLTRAVLLGERARSRGWFDHRHVADLVKEHISGAKNFTRELRALLAIELWARIFLDEHHMKVPTMNDLGVEMTPAGP